MKEAKAVLKNYRQSPRKVRLVADAVRGKKINDAITVLTFISKRSALPLKKLMASALANLSAGSQAPDENIIVKEIKVDAGPTLFRRRPRSRGMANPIRKRTSHITVILTDNPQPTTNKKSKKVVGGQSLVVS